MAEADTPSEPRPAATVILLRRGGKHNDRGLEVCLVKRNPEASFMPGVWVFPGGAVDPEDGDDDRAYRACAARELAEEAGVTVDPDELVLYSRWITPEVVSTRFDTQFFLALGPAHTPPEPDGEEAVDAGWFVPQTALDMHSRDELSLVFPTIKHLESLTAYASAEEALEAVRGQRVDAVLPRVLGEGDERRIVIPGDPGFDEAKEIR